ncbi:putative uncharacterized protein DDB_G0282133 [Diorhabda sublineata]|uniref:putative uncharacterized protein DDB_G0282133 n=1 Tax=Diorhabda sublineata TaxID=1163346 RepID=UPI0024E0B52E|nr:putative uncharacterized protein DDB_G0282133 [Diorhabda sublineata]
MFLRNTIMSNSFYTNFRYCSLTQISNNKKLKRCNMSVIFKDISDRVQLHLKGEYLLANCEITKYLELIASCTSVKYKIKYGTEKLKSILNIIYIRNKIFEKHMTKLPMSSDPKDPFKHLGISQDLQMLGTFEEKSKTTGLPINNNNQTCSFPSDMLTNQNFKSITEEFDKSTDKSELIRQSKCSALNQCTIGGIDTIEENSCFKKNECIYSNQLIPPETEINKSYEVTAVDFNLAEENRSLSRLNNVESVSFCSYLLPGNSSDNYKNDSHLLNNSPNNLQLCFNVCPGNISVLEDTHSDISYRDANPMQYLFNNNKDVSMSSDCLENTQNNDNQLSPEKHFNHSEDIFSYENSVELTQINEMEILDREHQTVQKKDETKRSLIIETSQKFDLNSSNINNVMTLSQNSDKSIQNIRTFYLSSSNNCNNESNSLNTFVPLTTLQDSCDNLCEMMSKFLNIVDDQDIKGNGAKCVDILKRIKNPDNMKKNVEEIGQLDFSDDFENINQSNQEICDLLMRIIDSYEFLVHNKEAFGRLKAEVIECLDPADIDDLDLNTLFDSNAKMIQDISKSFQKQLVIDFRQSNSPRVTYDCLDWRKIQI